MYIAKHRLAAEIAALKASGEPVMPEDFLDQPVPPDQDAGPDLLAAGKLFVVPKQYQAAWSPLPGLISNKAMVDDVLAANRETLAKVRAARGKRFVNWGLPIRSVGERARLPMLAELRQLADLLAVAAQQARLEQNSSESIECMRDWLVVARSLESQPLLISHLVASGMQEQAASRISMASVALTIDKGVNGASEAQVRGLIAELLDDNQTARSGRRWAWQGERMMDMQFIEAQMSDDDVKRASMGIQYSNRFVDWWMRPVSVGSSLIILERCNTMVNAAGAKDVPEALSIVRQWENRAPAEFRTSKNSQEILITQFEAVNYRRRAAVALAARLFKLKYFRSPRDVTELTTEFLPEAPADCLRSKGTKIQPPY